MLNENIEIIHCVSSEDFNIAKSLTSDYIKWLNIDLCFQDFDSEFVNFDNIYSKPNGCFLYLKQVNSIIGGGAFRKFEPSICEMKRLFVYPQFQGNKFGQILCEELIKVARDYGYKKMRLDTIAKLDKAINLYEHMGFNDINKYRDNPDKTARFMELNLENMNI